MKKVLCMVLALSLVFALCAPAMARDIKVTLNGTEILFDQPPIAQNERVLVPFRYIGDAMGANVGYDGETQTVIATLGDTTVVLQIGASEMHVNGEVKPLDVPSIALNGRTLIPTRAFAEAFDCDVKWDGDNYTVVITK